MKAVINGVRIECGKCGALLQKIVKVNKPVSGNAVLLRELDDNRVEGVYIGTGIKLECKCKHKDKGHICNTINEIEL